MSLDCRAVMTVLWDYIDGELPREEYEAIRGHIAKCKRCHPQYAFQFSFLEALAVLKAESPAPSAELKNTIERLARST